MGAGIKRGSAQPAQILKSQGNINSRLPHPFPRSGEACRGNNATALLPTCQIATPNGKITLPLHPVLNVKATKQLQVAIL